MRIIFAILASVVMIGYVAFRAFTTFVIMPLAGGSIFGLGSIFAGLLLLAIVSTVLSFTQRKGAAALLASMVGVFALAFWHFVTRGVRQDFIWLVIPEVCFSVAGIGKWLAFKIPERDVPTTLTL